MQKKNVLGTDPLSWLKEKDKKENSGSSESNINGQEKQADKPLEQKDVEEISAKSKILKVEAVEVPNIEKVLEKSKHEPVEIPETNKQNEEKAYESYDVTEEHRRKVLGGDAYAYHARTREVTQKESPATMFVIAYTILLLILGFIVYRDLTKQIDVLNTKLTKIEKQVDTGTNNYEETKVNNIW